MHKPGFADVSSDFCRLPGIPASLKRVADEPTRLPDRNVLVVGRTGVGKSLLAKVLTGNKTAFKTSAGTSSETKNITDCQSSEHKLVVFDTEGLSGTEINKPDEFLCQSERLFDAVLEMWTTVPEGDGLSHRKWHMQVVSFT